MGNVNVKEVRKIDPVRISHLQNIDPVTIASIQKIAPAAVHIKELNHIDPLLIESLRIDQVRNIDPVRVDRFNVTHLPTVNLSLSQLPALDLNVRRVPPVAIGVQQDFDLPSRYTVHTRLLGIEVLRLEVHGRTMMIPKDRFRREQSKTPERSFPEVAAVGNPAIPNKRIEKCVEAVTRAVSAGCFPPAVPRTQARQRPPRYRDAQVQHAPRARATLSIGAPRFQYSIAGGPGGAGSSDSGVSFGG